MEVLRILAIASLAASGGCALITLGDIWLGHKQKMPVMNWVWPTTALYAGPLGLVVYWLWGRSDPAHAHRSKERPLWQSVMVGDTHCGAGCVLGDVTAEWIVFLTGLSIAGSTLLASFALDFTLAYLAGIAFQYFAIAPMRNLAGWQGIRAAAKADTVSLVAFEIGMFAWMYGTRHLFHSTLKPNDPVYWFNMQGAMLVGFATAYPANWWLIRRGWKEAM